MWILLGLAATSNAVHYSGGLLGVKANVKLTQTPPRAAITLRGLPVGYLTGGAEYDSKFRVNLDDDFERRLRRFHVKILSVEPTVNHDRVFVTLRLPLFLGRRVVTLWKTI